MFMMSKTDMSECFTADICTTCIFRTREWSISHALLTAPRSLLSLLLEPGKHKHRKCERPLSAQPSKPVIVRPGSKRYDFSLCIITLNLNKPPFAHSLTRHLFTHRCSLPSPPSHLLHFNPL